MGRYWQCIKGYNGYEYSNDGLLRSMKNYKKYPYGKLLVKYKESNGKFYFFLSNNSNERVKVYEEDIIKIIKSDKNPIYRENYQTDISSRNTVLVKPRKKKNTAPLKQNIGIPKFSVVDEDNNSFKSTGKINPLIFYI